MIWSSQGTFSEAQCAIWSPSLQTSMLSSNKTRISLGYYADKGFNNPLKGSNANKFQTIEITDIATIRIKRAKTITQVLSTVFPHPLRYRQVWHLSRNGKMLYAWKPHAPDGFVALGMVFTATDDTPDVREMRCVPQQWCMKTKSPPIKIWDDSGAGGGKPGSIWIINSIGLAYAVPGHDAPREEFYEINNARFLLEGFKVSTIGTSSSSASIGHK